MSTNDVRAEIITLADLTLLELRRRWHALYRSEAPMRMSRELLARAIAHRIQEEAEGGLSPATQRKLAASADQSSNCATVVRKIKPGTRFLREWHGRTHEVTALPDGTYAYRDANWPSLSAIARDITGTRWSGPAFFGLTGARGNG
jgi:hypothetical protein